MNVATQETPGVETTLTSLKQQPAIADRNRDIGATRVGANATGSAQILHDTGASRAIASSLRSRT